MCLLQIWLEMAAFSTAGNSLKPNALVKGLGFIHKNGLLSPDAPRNVIVDLERLRSQHPHLPEDGEIEDDGRGFLRVAGAILLMLVDAR